MVARSYRDSQGARLKTVCVAKVLVHLLKDFGLPISTFGEETFTSILTYCTTPKEARRFFRLVQGVQNQISWSILVDLHAKLGGFQGCDQALREMVIEGVPPSSRLVASRAVFGVRTVSEPSFYPSQL
jgi:pentatricopeptide repeat protein